MKLPDRYAALARGEGVEPSVLVGFVPAAADPPAPAEVAARLSRTGLPVIAFDPAPAAEGPGWSARLDLRFADDEPVRHAAVALGPAEGFTGPHGFDVVLQYSDLTKSEVDATRGARWALGVEVAFAGHPLVELHRQLRLVAAAAQEAPAFLDVLACRPLRGAWVRDAAEAVVPPSPRNLYNVHYVTGGEDAPAWVHTHGLLRCGTVEVEMLDVRPSDGEALGSLVHAVAALFIERGLPPPGEPFAVGRDLEVAWLPWEEAVRQVGKVLGTGEDRDAMHARPAAALFARDRDLVGRRWASVTSLVGRLRHNPVLYFSSMETERMSLLARERLDAFRRAWAEWGSRDDWAFLVKLGYTVDGAAAPGEREHLWFHVRGFEGETVDATLVNEPDRIARMHEGDRARHDLALLTDWAIHSPRGRFDAESVAELFRPPDPSTRETLH